MKEDLSPLDIYDLLQIGDYDKLPYLDDAKWDLVPQHYRRTMYFYIVEGRDPGDFGKALFSNDLVGASWRADEKNAAKLSEIGRFINASVPSDCCGSREAVQRWMLSGGLKGLGIKARKSAEPVDA